jgi:transposase
VHVPNVEQEDAKRLHRERRRLIAERVQHVNRIKGLCAILPTESQQKACLDLAAAELIREITQQRPLN